MTRKQVIKELQKLGWRFIRKDGRFCVELAYPVDSEWAGKTGIFDPRDLLKELTDKPDAR